MKSIRRVTLLFLGLGAAFACGGAPATRTPLPAAHVDAPAAAIAAPPSRTEPVPPVAPREPTVREIHGRRLVDDYAWLRKKGSPEVLAYLDAENRYARAVLAPTEPLQRALYDEMVARMPADDDSVPVKRGAYLYWQRVEKGKEHPIRLRAPVAHPEAESVVLDANVLAATQPFVGIGPTAYSDDGKRFAYGLDTTGFRQFTLTIVDMAHGTTLADRAERVTSLAFAKDGRTVLYTTEDAQTKRSDRVMRHVIGEPSARDALVYEERDPMFDVEVARSRSGEFVVITSESKTTTEVRLVDAARPSEAPRVVFPREHGNRYYVEPQGARLLVRTDAGGRNFRLVAVSAKNPKRDAVRELVPHRDDVMLEGVWAFADHYVVAERKDGVVTLRIAIGDGAPQAGPSFPEPAYELRVEENPEYASHAFRVRYESLLTPPSIYDVDDRTRQPTLRKRITVGGGYDPSRYAMTRTQAIAKDGTAIPITIVAKNGAPRDGTGAMLLHGYGAYGVPYPVGFGIANASLLDRGVAVAIAHVRGGGDLGTRWHDEGRMQSKMNTFTDFIAAAESLVDAKWTSPSRLAIEGRSAGGLLVGAVLNLRPDLFKAAVAGMPFVDVMSTMLDESLPLTVGEFEEWGNPKNRDDFDRMIAYSPYDNVGPGPYPSLLVRSSYNDSQVMYWEPAKWVARMRATRHDENPLVLVVDMSPAGHGGRSGRYERVRDTAIDDAFVLHELGREAVSR